MTVHAVGPLGYSAEHWAAPPAIQREPLARPDGAATTPLITAAATIAAEAPAPPLSDAVRAFLDSRQVANCTAATLRTYAYNLHRFSCAAERCVVSEVTGLMVQEHLAALREHMQPISVHQPYRVLRTFLRWCVEMGWLRENPIRGLTMRTPRILPRVPDDDSVRQLLAACPETYEGRRNRALIAILGDSGLRIGEALRLRVADVSVPERTLMVRGGKGAKDGLGFFGAATAAMLQAWLTSRLDVYPEAFLFCSRQGQSLSVSHGTHILHRLSVRARLPRKIGPHALRHYAATSLLRQTGDLELVRRVLRHESLAMTLRYAHLTGLEVRAKFQRASPLDHLRAADWLE